MKFFPEAPTERDAVNRVLGYFIVYTLEAVSSGPLVYNAAYFFNFLTIGSMSRGKG